MVKSITQITFKELLSIVPDTSRDKVPSFKQLLMTNPGIICEVPIGECRLIVYRNGYFTYSNGRFTTVQSIYKCQNNIRYKSVTGDISDLNAMTFGDLPFFYRLALEGESRLERNENARELSRSIPLSQVEFSNVSQHDLCSVLDEVVHKLHRDELRKALAILTKKQYEAIYMYHYMGFSQQKIAELLGINKHSVYDRIQSAERKMKAYLKKRNVP